MRFARARNRLKKIVEFPITDSLGIVSGGIQIRHHRFVTPVHRLAPAQRIAAIE